MKEYHKMPVAELAYAAGLIDGEGCIRIGKYTDHKTQELRYRGQLSIGMTSRAAVEWMRDRMGGNFYIYRTSYDKAKPAYNWTMRSTEAAALLSAILPHLIIKREQALLLIEFAETVHQCWGRRGMPAGLNDRRAAMAGQSLALNRKGIAA